MEKSILITGCNGFVAKYLIESLLEEECIIFGIDLQQDSRYQDVHYFNISLLDKDSIISLIKEKNITEIYHLAAVASTIISYYNPYSALETNIIGTIILFEACRNFKEIKLLVVGSSEMYKSVGENVILTENSDLQSHSIYGVSKISTEIIGQEYVRQYGLNIVFTRSFNHTGPGQAPSYVLSDWAKQCAEISINNKPKELVVGNVSLSRDFLDVRDVVNAYILLLRKGISGEVYNVSSGKSFKLEYLLNYLIDLANVEGVSYSVDEKRIRKNDPLKIQGSNYKIKNDIQWDVSISIKQTLEDLFNFWKSKLRNEKNMY